MNMAHQIRNNINGTYKSVGQVTSAIMFSNFLLSFRSRENRDIPFYC